MEKTLDTLVGKVILKNPSKEEILELIALLQNEDLDLRGLVQTGRDSFSSQGKDTVFGQWKRAIIPFENKKSFSSAIEQQSRGILRYKEIPEKGIQVKDPFYMEKIEETASIVNLRQEQLANILILKKDNDIISSARILRIKNDWELVSVVTKHEYRKKGLASMLIKNIFSIYPHRPLYSFQTLDLVPYYMNVYQSENPTIPLFEELPKRLQQDLFNMNIFWGPHIIIKIVGNKD